MHLFKLAFLQNGKFQFLLIHMRHLFTGIYILDMLITMILETI